MLFPVDHGNSSIKTVNFVFSSGLADYPIRPPVDTDILEYGGKYWTLSGKRISYMRDKTKDDRYFILTLFAIAKELQKSDTMSPMVETDLAVGLPPEHYALRQRPCSVRNTQSGRFSSLLSPLGKAGMPLSQRRIESPLFKENVQFAATGLTFCKANCTLYYR